MDVKLILVGLTVLFTIGCLFFGTKNGFYDYHGNGSAHSVGDRSSDGEHLPSNL